MNNPDVFALILGMAVVTYLPRALPAVLLRKAEFAPAAERFLKLIPYTAMAVLIFPGIFTVDAAAPMIGIAGGLAAGILAWRGRSVLLCVLAAVGTNLILYAAGCAV